MNKKTFLLIYSLNGLGMKVYICERCTYFQLKEFERGISLPRLYAKGHHIELCRVPIFPQDIHV